MGIDVYMYWNCMTPDEIRQQYTGFSIEHGHVGYLREAYFRQGPSVIEAFLPETFISDDEAFSSYGTVDMNDGSNPEVVTERIAELQGVPFTAETLKERLPQAIKAACERNINNDWPSEELLTVIQSLVDFVKLAEQKEKETGKPVLIFNSY